MIPLLRTAIYLCLLPPVITPEPSPPPGFWLKRTRMGVKSLRCFPWYGRRKERKKSKTSQEETPAASPAASPTSPQEEKPRLHSTNSGGSDTDGGRAYFSGKARVSFRHQMDSNMYVNDSTF